MKNPWIALPDKPPYVLSSDVVLIEAFNLESKDHHKFDVTLLPEPFFGSLSASVLVLTLNPGLSPEDAETHARPEFCRLARLSLEHRLAPYPFLHLQPNGDTSGSRWWKTRTRELVEEVGFDAVARKLACVQFMPYHSTKFKKSRSLLPSQNYSFNLVQKAMERKAEIVVMRSYALWINTIPELANYKHLHCAANPRSPYLSRGNLKGSFNTVAQRLLEKG